MLSACLAAPVWLSPLLAQNPSAAVLAGGAPKLLDCIEAPYAYVALETAASNQAVGSSSAVQKLLADPSLDVIFGGATNPDGSQTGSRQALSLLRTMMGRGASQMELAMTGILARQGRPLLVLRARLSHDQASILRLKLEGSASQARPSRKFGDTQSYTFDNGANRGAGEVFEMALVGDDLVVGNDTSALREVLEPQPMQTGTQPVRRVLSADPRFLSLKKRLQVPAGSLIAYGDWQRLGQRLQSYLGGAPAQLLSSSGLGSARSVMIGIAPAKQDFAATLLLDFAFAEGRVADGQRPAHAPLASGVAGGRQGLGFDGWFDATSPVSAKTLLRELPRSGLGGMVLSVDLAAVAAHSPRNAHMVWDLRDAYTGFGLSFERNLLDRLASRGTVQLHFDAHSEPATDDTSTQEGKPEEGKPGGRTIDRSAADPSAADPSGRGAGVALAAVHPVYSVRAKSRTAAEDLFDDLRRVVEATDFGHFEVVKDAKGKRLLDIIQLTGPRVVGMRARLSAFVALHDDSVLFAEDKATLVQAQQELRRGKPHGRRDQVAANAIKTIGGDRVAGLFDLDLDPLFQRIASALKGVDLSALPKRHIGYLDTDRHQGGAVVRIRVLSAK
jgi:uncharacterized protein YuzB (UPF0349 family)